MALLRPVGDENGAPLALREGCLLYAGRGADCALLVADQAVSRKHASLELRGGKAVLRNLKGAAFPVFVNGAAVESATLKAGDEVAFQRVDHSFVSFRFEDAHDDATVAVRRPRGASGPHGGPCAAPPSFFRFRRLRALLRDSCPSAPPFLRRRPPRPRPRPRRPRRPRRRRLRQRLRRQRLLRLRKRLWRRRWTSARRC
jgi:hypothetical protein